MSLRSGRSVGKDPHVDVDSEPVLQFDTEPAGEPEELESLPTNEALANHSQEPAAHLNDARNETQVMSADTNDLPNMDMDRPLQVTFGKKLRYAPTFRELIHC